MNRLAAIAALLCLLVVPTLADEKPSVEKIEELLVMTGAGDMGKMFSDQMLQMLKPAMPQVPEEWWNAFGDRFDADDLIEITIPIYQKHFSAAEIDAMIEFNRTPEGRAIIKKMPIVMQESMAIGQEWGMRMADEVIRELEADGYEVPTQLKG